MESNNAYVTCSFETKRDLQLIRNSGLLPEWSTKNWDALISYLFSQGIERLGLTKQLQELSEKQEIEESNLKRSTFNVSSVMPQDNNNTLDVQRATSNEQDNNISLDKSQSLREVKSNEHIFKEE